jgi:predicted chitinase
LAYAATPGIHFEIVADKTNLKVLLGRASGPFAGAQGRTACVWGESHIELPAGTPVYAVHPRHETRPFRVERYALHPQPRRYPRGLASIAQTFETTPAIIRALTRPITLNGKPDTDDRDDDWFSKRSGSWQARFQLPEPSMADATIRVPAVYGAMPRANAEVLLAPSQWDALRVPVMTTTREPLIVSLREDKGSISVTTRDHASTRVGSLKQESSYDLYHRATTEFPGCPSAGYDMLRFGRVLGPDQPAEQDLHLGRLPHFRKIRYQDDQGEWIEGYVDLNPVGVKIYSDADFPEWQGWQIIDDGHDDDGRCSSQALLDIMDPPGTWLNGVARGFRQAAAMLPTEPAGTARVGEHATLAVRWRQAYARRNNAATRLRLSHAVIKAASDWSMANYDKRWSWLKTGDEAPYNVLPMCLSDAAYNLRKKHLQALSFWEEAQKEELHLDPVHYHFHPGRFIHAFKQCGWLSVGELIQLIPPKPENVSWHLAQLRARTYGVNLNKGVRKYSLCSSERLAPFLAQIYQETGCLTDIKEKGQGTGHDYGSFYGRGLMQLTWPANYAAYGIYRNFPPASPTTYASTGNSADPITATSLHEWSSPVTDKKHVVHHDRRCWAPRYDPSIIADDPFSACDSAGFFWVTKHYAGTSNINRLFEDGFSTDAVGKANVLVNGGSNGYNERQAYAAYVYRYLSDSTETSASENLNFTVYRIDHGTWINHGSASTPVDFSPQRQSQSTP